jgi:hypothetical protein
MNNLRKRMRYPLTVMAILLTGLIVGGMLGKSIFSGRIEKKWWGLFAATVAQEGFIETWYLLSSRDPLKRMAGYYSLTGKEASGNFLVERYDRESIHLVKSALLHVMFETLPSRDFSHVIDQRIKGEELVMQTRMAWYLGQLYPKKWREMLHKKGLDELTGASKMKLPEPTWE